jgi:murein L,D-transpeptidase YafK
LQKNLFKITLDRLFQLCNNLIVQKQMAQKQMTQKRIQIVSINRMEESVSVWAENQRTIKRWTQKQNKSMTG